MFFVLNKDKAASVQNPLKIDLSGDYDDEIKKARQITGLSFSLIIF